VSVPVNLEYMDNIFQKGYLNKWISCTRVQDGMKHSQNTQNHGAMKYEDYHVAYGLASEVRPLLNI